MTEGDIRELMCLYGFDDIQVFIAAFPDLIK